MTTIQERLRDPTKAWVTKYFAEEAADRIDLDTDHIEMLARVVDKALAERDEYRLAADTQAKAHKEILLRIETKVDALIAERDGLATDKEVLLGHMSTIRNCTNDPAIATLTRVVIERMAQGGEK